MAPQYTFDDRYVRLKKTGRNIWGVVSGVLIFLAVTVALTVVSYVIFSLFFSTDTERRLRQENRMYSKVYPEMKEKDRLLSDVVSGLEVRDNDIYKSVFHTDAPNLGTVNSADPLFSEVSIDDVDIALVASQRLGRLEEKTETVEDNFKAIFEILGSEDFVLPPMHMPLKDFNYSFTGATVGSKISPFYKVATEHHGLDLIAATGTPVYATGDGVVTTVTRNKKGLGNTVEITHAGGYVTRYAQLDQILVTKGKKVDKDTQIGKVGTSGTSFAPHLHYEVLKDEEVRDPVNYFFSDLTPSEYVGMLIIAATTGQSME